MPAVPVLTIPESSYDPSLYSLQTRRGKSQILIYLIKLTHGSAFTLALAYIIGLLVIKPLLETKASRRLELLESARVGLRDFYLKLIGKVSHIPIVAIRKPGDSKFYSDAVVQTHDSHVDKTRVRTDREKWEELIENDKLAQGRLHEKLKKLSTTLNDECRTYSSLDMDHYKSANYAIKDFQNKADLVYFNSTELFMQESAPTDTNKSLRKKNSAVEARNEIRSIKGLYMSGQA
ncbi:uncharacterized protein SPAPADRAFT_60228 [Spathaspora passalidarum NRRL Y-27907]|uniref:Uncharacterized protein n=1 Tax=Spathaspora passalidarum (strain NRRL Y-27907 / 11-Y1) TaxID=619300 RepID=G3AK75_SPAPN|nr:uncharacterized protein SPAPADRAFT_60228 [Spathaspora passalidarum NRRL Y-27907]EGW32886.1 hypothetical protein SPAPADRAFT_60228 [Spathaspora passalidarum NRRL Y-27907]